jgi:hypothetical protein
LKNRDKASDIFNKGEPLFGKKIGFAEAFPTIAAIAVEVTIDGRGVRGLKETSRFDAGTLRGEFLDCRDPRCYGGGFQIGAVLRTMVTKKQTHHVGLALCEGTEGGTARKRGSPCITQFDYHIDIVYK